MSSDDENFEGITEPVPSKPFFIVLGDNDEFHQKILKKANGWKRVMVPMRGANWNLEKTDKALYWILNEDENNLKHQFMIYKNPTVYIFFNYRGNQPVMDVLNRYHEIMSRDLGKHQIKCLICGMKFQNIKIHKSIKKEILQWCLSRQEEFGEEACDYLEFNDLTPDQF